MLSQHTPQAPLPPITLKGTWGHVRTITRHKLLVGKLCFDCGLYWQGIMHDFSKYSPTEFWRGARYFVGTRSPNANERSQTGMSRAWLHHKGRNRHHFEHWIDVPTNKASAMTGMPMPTRYVVEMVCDRIAACRVYQGSRYTPGSALAYFQLETSLPGLLMHPATRALLELMLQKVADLGEKDALAWIRKTIVKPRLVYVEGGSF